MGETTKKILGDIELITLTEAAKRLGLKGTTNLPQAIRDEKLAGVLLGHIYFTTPAAVEQYREKYRGRFGGRDPKDFYFNKINLTDQDRGALLKMIRGRDRTLALRAKAILMISEGGRPHKFSKKLKTTSQSVYTWARRFFEEGPEGLRNKRNGRPRKTKPLG